METSHPGLGLRVEKNAVAILVVTSVSNNAKLIASGDKHPRYPDGRELARG
jgi:hypothetical protein